MTPWDQGPEGAGQEAIYEGIPNAEKHVIARLEPLDGLRQHRGAQPRRDRLLPAPQPSGSYAAASVPAVEEYGVEPIPAELRTARWRDLFAINFTFFLNPVMYVVGAIAVAGFGLPLWWAILAIVVGQALAYAVMVPIAEVGRRLRAARPGRDARDARLLGRAAAQLARTA